MLPQLEKVKHICIAIQEAGARRRKFAVADKKNCTASKKSFSKGKKSNIFKVTSNRRRERDGRFFKVPLATGRTGADGIVSQRHFQSASAR